MPRIPTSAVSPTSAKGVSKPSTPLSRFRFPPFVPSFLALAAGVGTGRASVSPVARAAAGGVGTALLRPAVTLRAAGSGSGTVSTIPKLDATPTGAGITTAAVSQVASAAAPSGTGTLTVPPAVVARAFAGGTGTVTAKPAVTAKATASGTGTTTATVVTFTNMGMRKNGDYTLATFASNIEIPNWLAATSDPGFEGSVVAGHRLGPATGTAVRTVNLTTRMDNNFAGNVTLQVMRNSTVIGTATVTVATTVQSFSFPDITITAGDVLWINATNSNSARVIYAVDTLLYFA